MFEQVVLLQLASVTRSCQHARHPKRHRIRIGIVEALVTRVEPRIGLRLCMGGASPRFGRRPYTVLRRCPQKNSSQGVTDRGESWR